MAVFGAPTALEDHAFRACLPAVGVQEEAKRLAVDIQERDGVDLRMRVGLNAGQADAAGGPAVLACWGGPEMAVREAQDEASLDISEQAWRVAVQQPEQQRGPLPGRL